MTRLSANAVLAITPTPTPEKIARAAIDTEAYVLHPDVVDDYAVGPAILARIDQRRSAGGPYVSTYAPITEDDTPSGVDSTSAFEDAWDEVITLDEYRAIKGF